MSLQDLISVLGDQVLLTIVPKNVTYCIEFYVFNRKYYENLYNCKIDYIYVWSNNDLEIGVEEV